jgi:predicted Fe-Mo cluster-binding NifX family protein
MKIAISATGPSLDSLVDPRFGRCATFVLIQTDDLSVESIENGSGALSGGAGIQAAQLVAQAKAKIVLTGACGPNAHETLTAAGIEVRIGTEGTVREAFESYQAGRLRVAAVPNVGSHAGMGGPQR